MSNVVAVTNVPISTPVLDRSKELVFMAGFAWSQELGIMVGSVSEREDEESRLSNNTESKQTLDTNDHLEPIGNAYPRIEGEFVYYEEG